MNAGRPVYADLAERLFTVLTHLRSIADAYFNSFGDDEVGPYLVFGLILNPHLAELRDAEPTREGEDELRPIFNLLEAMTEDQPVEPGYDRHSSRWIKERSRELVRVGVVEFLRFGSGPKTRLDRASMYLGSRTRQLLAQYGSR